MLMSIKEKVDQILFGMLFVLLFLMLFCVCWQVFSRYILKSPAIFTEELVRFVLIWTGLLGASYAFGQHKHLSLSLLYDKMPLRLQTIITIGITLVIMSVSVGLLMYGGSRLMLIAWTQKSSVLAISMSNVYAILPLSGSLILFYHICDLYNLLHKKGGH